MTRKESIDAPGAIALVMFSCLMGVNQVMIKLVNEGMSPVFQAGARSACALIPVLIFALVMQRRLSVTDGSFLPGMLCGLLFAAEFMLLFQGIEYTAVSRASVVFYTMPVWVAIAAHFLIPGEVLTRRRALGLAAAVLGVGIALLDEPPDFAPDALFGDLLCILGSLCWAGIALTVRLSRLNRSEPEMQLIYQLAVSGPLLMLISPAFGPAIREMTEMIVWLFAFQVLAVVAFGMLVWFMILRVYPASDMTAFSFLAPLFGVVASWTVLDEPFRWAVLLALALVGIGIALISIQPRKKAVATGSDPSVADDPR